MRRMLLTISRSQKSLLLAGAVLFLIGLLQGGAVHLFANPRMALSAHLTAVQSGMALMIAGLLWSAMSLPAGLAAIARWATVTGMYGLWAGLTLAAATGASAALPMAGAGHHASTVAETLVSALVLGPSGLMALGWLLVVAGLMRSKPDSNG